MATAPEESVRRAVRSELIRLHEGFAEHLARRFRHRGEPLEDLRQVAVIGLIKAVDGFDYSRGTSFTSYAVPTILGELRRHFRDKGWTIRVPRRLQELRADINAVTERLTHELGRTPGYADIAEELGVSEQEVREGVRAAHAYSAHSLQQPVGDEEGTMLGDVFGEPEAGFEQVEVCEVLRTLLPRLPARERHIIGLRFYRQMTQSEIAAELGISQMHVSRLLARALAFLRAELTRSAQVSLPLAS